LIIRGAIDAERLLELGKLGGIATTNLAELLNDILQKKTIT